MLNSSKRRAVIALLSAAILIPVPLSAQSSGTTDDENAPPRQKTADEEALEAERAGFGRVPEYDFLIPNNTVEIGVRVMGKTNVTFSNVGIISNPSPPVDDMTSPMRRTYNNGVVGPDLRGDSRGSPVPADGKTNNWGYDSASQVSEDGSGIYMTAFSTEPDGSIVTANSGAKPGVDIEFSRRLGGRKIKWGVQAGLAMTEINAATTGEITASLRSITDFYSLLGAAAPDAPYAAPTTRVDTVVNPDGSSGTVSTDTSTLLAELPSERTDTLDVSGAQISGLWQVKGSYFSAHLGGWAEMPLTQAITVRASGGVSARVIGAFMRFDERYELPNDGGTMMASDLTNTDTWAMMGGYAALETQYWLTERTGFFAGATVEAVSGDVDLKAGERIANLNVQSTAGVRVGFTTRF